MTMRLRTNEVYKAIVAELEAIGATYTVEAGSKHFMLRYEKGEIKGQTTVAVSSGDWRSPLNARRDIRKTLREHGLIPTKTHDAFDQTEAETVTSPVTPTETPMRTIEHQAPASASLDEGSLVMLDGEPRMRDIDIGAALGYTPVLNVRALIRANFEEIGRYGTIAEEPVPAGPNGGRPSVNYMLNREQAILVAVLSRTQKAADVRYQVIKAYTAWEEHNNKPQSPVVIEKGAEPEILMNDQAIDAIVERLRGIVPADRATSVAREVTAPGAAHDLVTRKQFEEVMGQMVAWQKQRFERIDRALSEPAVTPQEVDSRVVDHMRSLNADLLRDVRSSMTEAMQVVDRSMRELFQGRDEARLEAHLDAQIGSVPIGADISIRPEVEPNAVAGDFVVVSDIYVMAGIDPKDIPAQRRLSRIMAESLAEYAEAKGQKTYMFKGSFSNPRRQWTRDLVNQWYRDIGRQIIIWHVREQEFAE